MELEVGEGVSRVVMAVAVGEGLASEREEEREKGEGEGATKRGTRGPFSP